MLFSIDMFERWEVYGYNMAESIKQVSDNKFSLAIFAPGFVWERNEGNQDLVV